MKLFFLALLVLLVIPGLAKCREIPVKFVVNGKETTSIKYYLIYHQKAERLQCINGKIHLPDTIKGYEILFVSRKYHSVITSIYQDSYYLHIYFDNRLCHNLANKLSGGDWFKLKYLFRRKFLIDFGNGLVGMTFQVKDNYLARYNIPRGQKSDDQ